jgi:hypothetical protein
MNTHWIIGLTHIGRSGKETPCISKIPEEIHRKGIGRVASPVGPLMTMLKASDDSSCPVS